MFNRFLSTWEALSELNQIRILKYVRKNIEKATGPQVRDEIIQSRPHAVLLQNQVEMETFLFGRITDDSDNDPEKAPSRPEMAASGPDSIRESQSFSNTYKSCNSLARKNNSLKSPSIMETDQSSEYARQNDSTRSHMDSSRPETDEDSRPNLEEDDSGSGIIGTRKRKRPRKSTNYY